MKKSRVYRDCAEAYFLRSGKRDTSSLLSGKQMSLHQEQVKKKWQKMVHIVDVIKVIGECGLSQRGSKAEAAYTIKDSTADHGNFLDDTAPE